MVDYLAEGRRMSEQAVSTIRLTIDGHSVEVEPGTTLWDAARQADIEIPVLCHDPRLPPVGVCRVCLVDVGENRLTASCVREAEDGMEVTTRNAELSPPPAERCTKLMPA